MEKRIRPIIAIAIGICLFVLPLCGCGASNPRIPNMINPRGTGIPNVSPRGGIGFNISPSLSPAPTHRGGTPAITTAFDKAKADTIRKDLLKMSGVKSASVVVKDGSAIVWIKFTGKNLKATESKIVSKCKQVDKKIKAVHIGTSTALMTGVDTLLRDITAGKPVSDLTIRFNSLLKVK